MLSLIKSWGIESNGNIMEVGILEALVQFKHPFVFEQSFCVCAYKLLSKLF